MNYWLSVFNDVTWRQFREMPSKVCAFPEWRRRRFPTIEKDDQLICYISKKKVWAGVLRVSGERFEDEGLIYDGGVFPNRIPVEPLIICDVEEAVPMSDLEGLLTFYPMGRTARAWAPFVWNPPKKLHPADAHVIINMLGSKVSAAS